MKILTTLCLGVCFLLIGELHAQKVQINSYPPKSIVIIEGTSTVPTTPTRKKVGGRGVLIARKDHLPAFFHNDSINDRIDCDLVPVRDLIGSSKTKTIGFSKLVLNLPTSKEIVGSVGSSERKIYNSTYVQNSLNSNIELWQKQIQEELKNRKVQINYDEVDLFGGQKTRAPEDLLIGAEITDLWISTTLGQSYMYVEVKWSVFDKKQRKVILETTSYGYGQGREGNRTHLDEVFTNATTNLTSDESFVSAIMRNSDEEEMPEGPEAIPILAITDVEIAAGSNLIKRCIASTVTLVTEDGHGSGVVISDEGYILTNHHVVEDNAVIRVLFSSGLELEAEVIRSDEYFDVALVKINTGKGYQALPLGISHEMPAYEVGDDVMAIGTPEYLELGQTVSRGIVSGNRKTEDRLFIQTDVSINPGNSGGPLINNKGQVIGLVTMKKFDSTGIGFAVPVDQAIEALGISYQ